MAGVLTSGHSWIQNARTDNTATAYDIFMQPNGGRLGLGITVPSASLHVVATSTTSASLGWGATAGQIFRNENSELAIGLSSTSPFPLWIQGRNNTSTTRDIVLQPAGGNVGINTLSPATLIDARGVNPSFRIYQNVGGYECYVAVDSTNVGWVGSTNATPWTVKTNNIERLRIDTSGNLFATASNFTVNQETASGFLVKGNSNITGSVGIGVYNNGAFAPTTTASLHVVGAGQTTSSFPVTSSMGGTIVVQDNGVSAGNGGAIFFGAAQGLFVGMKALMQNGNSGSIGHLAFMTRISISDTNLTEAMRISSAGNVGIGNNSPTNKLDVTGTTGTTALTVSGSTNLGTGGGSSVVVGNGTDATSMTGVSGNIRVTHASFATGVSARRDGQAEVGMRASTTGELGTFTNHDLVLLRSGSENIRLTSTGMKVTGSAHQFTGSMAITGSSLAMTGDITATGNITANFSDDRLKTKLGNILNALDKVQALSGFYYEPNETAQALGYPKQTEVGVSAQQVETVLPEIISPAPIDPQYKTVRYERLIPLLIEAVKELKTEIDELKSKQR